MRDDSLNFTRVIHTAAWVWLGYLFLLAGVDAYLYAGHPLVILGPYYLINGAIALLFLGFSYWEWLQNRLKSFYVPLMLLIIAGLPIIASRLWIRPFPPGPLSNVEGLTLRLLPVLFIGLVIVAWQYRWEAVVVFALGTAVLDIALVMINTPNLPAQATATHAVVFVTIVRSVSFLVIGYFINVLAHQLRAQQAQLIEANARLVHYASTIEQLSISRERNRLARELHDTLAHTLSGLAVQLETTQAYWDVDPETARDLLARSLAATRSGLNETRRALKALRASPIDDLGLLLALQKLTHSAAERGKLTLSLSLPEQIPSLSPDVEQCVYRIAQEALENVVYHANAQTLAVLLNISAEEIHLKIADDGLGFDKKQFQETGHYGLAGMRERAQAAGGDLTINSQPGQGTTVQLNLKGF
ncbi:MAG: sensor histidine kinase [Ardenticatenaceae bacterium]|nr:sensor histidine kinase [Anaerolineales bacterium]MCB8920290.1 sensor histidine kinase [Ardenticatenaceae bacterium]